MKLFVLTLALAGVGLLGSCTSSSEANRPHIYRGGQDYESAAHPDHHAVR
jgi:hypothetical protein